VDKASASITTLPVRRAPDAGDVLSRSHADYPSFRHIFPDPERRARAQRALFAGVARDAARLGTAWAAITAGDVVAGVAIWLAPGRFPWSAMRQLRGAGWMLGVLRADPGRFRTFMQTGINAAQLHPDDPHWYLEVMGVRPEAQGMGLGGRLLAPALEIGDRDRVDCYLETARPENAAFYERHGFAVEETELHQVPGGPPHLSMRRRPA
jgi:ribosomal protein S18 acetylase RimI-like enzyme